MSRRKSRDYVVPREGSPFWYSDFTVNGRRVRRCTETGDRAQAAAIVAKWRHEALNVTKLGKRPEMTLDEAFGRYIDEHATHLKSLETIGLHSRHLLAHFGKAELLSAIDDNALARYVARRRAKVSNSTVNREVDTLQAVLHRARDLWRVETGDFPSFKRHRLPMPEPRDRYETPDRVRTLVTAAEPHLAPAIIFAILTGVRRANVLGADWQDIDMRARRITFRVKSRKPGGKILVLDMSEELFVFLANLGPKEKGLVFTYQGQPIKKFRRSWATACKRAKLENFRFHDLRHTFASWKLQAGVPLDVVQDLLGHANIQTTRRYARHAPSAKAKAMETGPRLLDTPTEEAIRERADRKA